MAREAEFVRRIQRRAREVETGTTALLRRTALAINTTVILATPVDTGRARANWQASIGTPITEETDREDKSGQATIQANTLIINGGKAGRAIILSNNLPYIGELNAGSSSQAPENFVEIAIGIGVATARKTRVFKR